MALGQISGLLRLPILKHALQWYRRNVQIHGLGMLAMASMVYFSQGARGPLDDSIQYIGTYDPDFQVNPKEITGLIADGKTPWTLKFVFGLIADNLPIIGYNYKPYMMFCCLFGAVAIFMSGLPSLTPNWTWYSISYVIVQYYAAIVDCLGDALIIKSGKADKEDASSGLQSISWFTLGVGGAVATLIASRLQTDPAYEDSVSYKGARTYNLIVTAFPILTFICLFFVKEERTKYSPGFKILLQQLVKLIVVALSPPFIVLRTAIWIVASRSCQISLGSPINVFVTNELELAPDVQGYLSVASYAFLSIGVVCYYRFFRHTSFRWIFGVTQIITALFGGLDYMLVTKNYEKIGFSPFWFLFTSGAMETVLDRLNSMPFFVMAGQLCPDGMEATFFSLMMSILNFGSQLSSSFGKLALGRWPVTKGFYENLPWLVVFRSILTASLTTLILLVPNTSALSPANADSLKPTNPYIIRLLKFADIEYQIGYSKVEESKEI